MEYVLSVVVSVCSAFMAFMLQSLWKDNKRLRAERVKDMSKKEKGIEIGLIALLRVQLIEYHTKYMSLGTIPTYAFDNFRQMHAAYVFLSQDDDIRGNALINHMWEDIQTLQIKND